jgi:hypothetical protein
LCSKHFAESDFCTSERVRLNQVAVPHNSDSFSHSIPQPLESAYYIPSLNSLPTILTPEHDLHVLPPTRTYGKASVSSTKTPVPDHADSPSTSRQIPGFHTPPPGVRTFAVEENYDRNLLLCPHLCVLRALDACTAAHASSARDACAKTCLKSVERRRFQWRTQ